MRSAAGFSNGETMKKTITEFRDINELSSAAAGYVYAAAKAEVKRKGYFTLALSGGKTIIPFYKKLVREKMPWKKTYIFWQDDRFVKYSHKDSNVRLVFDNLISPAKIPFDNIYPAPAHDNFAPAHKAAWVYELIIRQVFKHLRPGKAMPSFDLIIGGMGDDGHTASLFPGDVKALNEKTKLITSVKAPKYAAIRERITMTLKLMNKAKNILMLTEEKGREAVLERVLKGDKRYPAARLNPKERLTWMIAKT